MKLTEHFKQRWIERFGYEPSVKEIKKLVKGAKFVQSRKVLWDDKNKRPYKILRVVLVSGLGIVIKLDKKGKDDVAVTII